MATKGTTARQRPMNDESNGMMKTLWADLRKVQLPRADNDPTADVFEQEQVLNAEIARSNRRVHDIGPERRDRWRRRYWGQ